MPALNPEEGTSSNRYTILGRLAGGGMADIFLAKSSSEGGVERYVVLKRVLAERSKDPVFASMFLDEARLAAQLQHPNIAQVHDIGRLAGCYFFTMEYVHGEDVRAMLHAANTARKIVPLGVALTIATSTLAALHHAHTRTDSSGQPLGIVHRDVSPSNVMVSYEGAVKLLDFGVAKASQRQTESHSGAIKGKIAYLSPEQCRGQPVDRRSDIFAFGIVLHEMLTQRRLYKKESDFTAMMAIVEETPPLPSSIRPGLPPELDKVVMRALAKDPADRYPTAAAMLEALEAVAAVERLALSPTASGRFLRELFGERPEPWLVPREAEVENTDVTVTGSFSDMSIDVHDPALLEQLAHARPIKTTRLVAVAVPDSAAAVPTQQIGVPTTPMDIPAVTRDALPTSPMRPVVMPEDLGDLPPDPFMSGVSTTPLPKPTVMPVLDGMKALPKPVPAASARSMTGIRPRKAGPSARVGVIIVVAAACIGVGIAVIATRGGSGGSETRVGQIDTPAAKESPPPPPPAPAPAPAKVDTPVVGTGSGSGSIETPAPKPKSIGELAADSAWPMVLEACAGEKPSDATTRATCATAACILKKADVARDYAKGLGRKDRAPAEAACKGQNIALVVPATAPPPKIDKPVQPPPADPCELHPLECQK